MLRALGLPFICLAMFSIAGGHWAVLQTIAWVQMVAEYSQFVSVTEAVEMTLSGEAPCSMCKKIAEAKHKEEKAPAIFKSDKKAEGYAFAASRLLPEPPHQNFSYCFPRSASHEARTEQPPVPVPIFA